VANRSSTRFVHVNVGTDKILNRLRTTIRHGVRNHVPPRAPITQKTTVKHNRIHWVSTRSRVPRLTPATPATRSELPYYAAPTNEDIFSAQYAVRRPPTRVVMLWKNKVAPGIRTGEGSNLQRFDKGSKRCTTRSRAQQKVVDFPETHRIQNSGYSKMYDEGCRYLGS